MKCSRRLTAVSVTNIAPECLLKSGLKPARIGSTFSSGTTVKTITWLLVSLNSRWPSWKPWWPLPDMLLMIVYPVAPTRSRRPVTNFRCSP